MLNETLASIERHITKLCFERSCCRGRGDALQKVVVFLVIGCVEIIGNILFSHLHTIAMLFALITIEQIEGASSDEFDARTRVKSWKSAYSISTLP